MVSAHSTRVGTNQDFFAASGNLAGIFDALRWKSPRMPMLYNRNMAAEQGAAGPLAREDGIVPSRNSPGANYCGIFVMGKVRTVTTPVRMTMNRTSPPERL